MPAISTGLKVTQAKTAPVSRILITPVSTAVRKAISRPLEKSFQSRVSNFDFMAHRFYSLTFTPLKLN